MALLSKTIYQRLTQLCVSCCPCVFVWWHVQPTEGANLCMLKDSLRLLNFAQWLCVGTGPCTCGAADRLGGSQQSRQGLCGTAYTPPISTEVPFLCGQGVRSYQKLSVSRQPATLLKSARGGWSEPAHTFDVEVSVPAFLLPPADWACGRAI